MMTLHNPGNDDTDLVARGFIDAARQKIKAEIAAVHESRARRREASTTYTPDAGGIRLDPALEVRARQTALHLAARIEARR